MSLTAAILAIEAVIKLTGITNSAEIVKIDTISPTLVFPNRA